MTAPPLFPGFDGLMTLSRREGVDIRPTLLRVLTDLYVQARAHSGDEERQFVELTSRLIDQVDDATRAAVRARLAIYPGTPVEIMAKLGLKPADPDRPIPLAAEIPVSSGRRAAGQAARPKRNCGCNRACRCSQPDAAEINEMFFGANSSERALILHNLEETPLKAAARIPAFCAERAIETLEMAAFAADIENFTLELGETLILPAKVAAAGGQRSRRRAAGLRGQSAGHAGAVFQRVLIFLPDVRLIGDHRLPAVAAVRPPERTIGADHAGGMARLDAWRSPAPNIAPRSTTTNATARARRRRRPARPFSPASVFGTRNTSRASGS